MDSEIPGGEPKPVTETLPPAATPPVAEAPVTPQQGVPAAETGGPVAKTMDRFAASPTIGPDGTRQMAGQAATGLREQAAGTMDELKQVRQEREVQSPEMPPGHRSAQERDLMREWGAKRTMAANLEQEADRAAVAVETGGLASEASSDVPPPPIAPRVSNGSGAGAPQQGGGGAIEQVKTFFSNLLNGK